MAGTPMTAFRTAYSETCDRWFVVTEDGHLAHVDNQAASFASETEAQSLADSLSSADSRSAVSGALPQLPLHR